MFLHCYNFWETGWVERERKKKGDRDEGQNMEIGGEKQKRGEELE